MQPSIDRGEEVLVRKAALVPFAVDEERRGSVDAATHPAEEVRLYLGGELPGRQCIAKTALGQAEGSAQSEDERDAELILIGVEPVVHLPKALMSRRVFRRLRGRLCERVRLGQRKVSEHEPELLGKSLLQPLEARKTERAIGTFIVAIFDERDRRVRRTLDVVSRPDWNSQFAHDGPLALEAS